MEFHELTRMRPVNIIRVCRHLHRSNMANRSQFRSVRNSQAMFYAGA